MSKWGSDQDPGKGDDAYAYGEYSVRPRSIIATATRETPSKEPAALRAYDYLAATSLRITSFVRWRARATRARCDRGGGAAVHSECDGAIKCMDAVMALHSLSVLRGCFSAWRSICGEKRLVDGIRGIFNRRSVTHAFGVWRSMTAKRVAGISEEDDDAFRGREELLRQLQQLVERQGRLQVELKACDKELAILGKQIEVKKSVIAGTKREARRAKEELVRVENETASAAIEADDHIATLTVRKWDAQSREAKKTRPSKGVDMRAVYSEGAIELERSAEDSSLLAEHAAKLRQIIDAELERQRGIREEINVEEERVRGLEDEVDALRARRSGEGADWRDRAALLSTDLGALKDEVQRLQAQDRREEAEIAKDREELMSLLRRRSMLITAIGQEKKASTRRDRKFV